MELVRPKLSHYKAAMAADRDFESVGEESYTGCKGPIGYLGWLALVEQFARPERLDDGESPNEIYFLVDENGDICGFGQLRMYDTEDALTWAGHIGYSVPPKKRGRGYAKELLRRLLEMGFDRGMQRIILTCDVDNDASRHIIEKAGGEFDGYYRDMTYNKRVYCFYKKG